MLNFVLTGVYNKFSLLSSLPPKIVQAQKKGKKSKSELKGNEENNEATNSANENKIKALVRLDSREDSPSLEAENCKKQMRVDSLLLMFLCSRTY